MSKFRRKVSRKGSKRLFTATASRTHIKNNLEAVPMRGGIRLQWSVTILCPAG